MIKEGGDTNEKRLAHGFRLTTGRLPTAKEKAILAKLLAQHQQDFATDKLAAENLLKVGDAKRDEALVAADLAAYTLIGNLLLNLDEVVTKE
jgi:hypothetical protein